MPIKSSSYTERAPPCCQVGTLSLYSLEQRGLQLMKTTLTFKTMAHSCALQHCRTQMLISIIQEEIYGSIQMCLRVSIQSCEVWSDKNRKLTSSRSAKSRCGWLFNNSNVCINKIPMSPLIQFLSLSLSQKPAWPEVSLSASLALSL